MILGVLALTLVVDALGFFEAANHRFYDLLLRIRGERVCDTRILIGAVDEASLSKLGKWPIRRTHYARLLERLAQADAVALDIILAEPDQDDPALAAALRRPTAVAS